MANDTIIIGNHIDIRGIGDGIVLTGVIREVNEAMPDKKIIVRTRASKAAFENNPRIYKIEDDLVPHAQQIGNGHYITQRCRYFGIENPRVHGELFITDKEKRVAEETLKLLTDKPTIMFCYNSTDMKRNWTKDNWIKVIDALSSKYDVFQIEQNIHYHRWPGDRNDGMPCIYPTIPNARQELRNTDIRKLMALMSVSKKYLGPNTGFMHIARCFGVDNFVFMHHDYAGGLDWRYDDNQNFWENDPLEDVINRVCHRWM